MDFVISWLQTNWQISYLIYSTITCILLAALFKFLDKSRSGAARLAKMWGATGFALLVLYLLGASESRVQFLSLFAFGAMGTALGYLAGVWLSPSSLSEENRFAKAQNLIATLFAGAAGTKLLSFWDDLTKGDSKLIYQPAYYLPLLCFLVGFFIALAAFYTLRSVSSGQVRITAPASDLMQWLDANNHGHDNGVRASSKIQFSGAADFADDMSVSWSIQPQNKQAASVPLPEDSLSATGLLKAPPADWIAANPSALDWTVVATSNRDRSRCALYDIHFV